MFNGVTYLGCATVNAPRSEVEIYRNMAVLNEQSQSAIPVVLSVPSTADGTVRLDFGFFFFFLFLFFPSYQTFLCSRAFDSYYTDNPLFILLLAVKSMYIW